MSTKTIWVLCVLGVCGLALSGCKGSLTGPQPNASTACPPGTTWDSTSQTCVRK